MPNNKELLEYRARLFQRTRQLAAEFCAACRAVSQPWQPLQPGDWNTHQIAAHVRDVNRQVYGLRLRHTLTENMPRFENFDADTWAQNSYQPDETLDEILHSLQTELEDLLALLENQPPQTWSRLSRHDTLGEITLQGWLERLIAHLEEHWRSLA